MKNLIGKVKTVKVKFLETETVEVRKLSVAQVREFQAQLTAVKESTDEDSGIAIQRSIIRMAVVGAADMTDDELDAFPIADLAALVQTILELAGLATKAVEGNDSATKT